MILISLEKGLLKSGLLPIRQLSDSFEDAIFYYASENVEKFR